MALILSKEVMLGRVARDWVARIRVQVVRRRVIVFIIVIL